MAGPPKAFPKSTYYYTVSPQMADNIFFPINAQGYEGGIYFSIDIWIYNTIFRSMDFNLHLLRIEEKGFWECHPL